MKSSTKDVVMNFLGDRIITRFGAPAKITTENDNYFSSLSLENFYFKYGIFLSHSSNYYPQGNGLAIGSFIFEKRIRIKEVADKSKQTAQQVED
jgi:hypothetical protein